MPKQQRHTKNGNLKEFPLRQKYFPKNFKRKNEELFPTNKMLRVVLGELCSKEFATLEVAQQKFIQV